MSFVIIYLSLRSGGFDLIYDAISSISTRHTLDGLGFSNLVGPRIAASQKILPT